MSAFHKPTRLPWVLCTLLLALFYQCSTIEVQAQPKGGPAPVVVSRVVQRNVTAAQFFVGTVLPKQIATIGSAVDGRVVEFAIEEGDRVEAKQALAQLLTDTIKLELEAAQAELNYRQEQLQELENGSRKEDIEQARARMAAAEARSIFRQASLERIEVANRRSGAVSADELEEAQSALIEAREFYQEMKAAHDLAVAGPRPEVIAQARAQVAIQQAVVNKLSDQIKKHTIISRFAGYVVKEHTEIGQWVNRGDPVAEVAALDEVDVVAQVVEQSIPFIQLGANVRVEIPALSNHVFVGKVHAVVPQADQRARTFPVKIRLVNELSPTGPLIQAGMYARVALPVGAEQVALLVPKDAIVLGGPKPMVYAVSGAQTTGDEGTVQPVQVELGVAHGDWIQVFGAVEPSQFVVIQGNERLRPNAPVKLLSITPDLPAETSESESAQVSTK